MTTASISKGCLISARTRAANSLPTPVIRPEKETVLAGSPGEGAIFRIDMIQDFNRG